MNDLDSALARVRDLPVPPRLAAIDTAVLARIAARDAEGRAPAGRLFGLAALAALAIGMAGAVLPEAPVKAAAVVPFGAPAALLPSSLLGNGE